MRFYLRAFIAGFLFLLGGVLLVLPVPLGMLIIAVGVILISNDVPVLRRFLMQTEQKSVFLRTAIRRLRRIFNPGEPL